MLPENQIENIKSQLISQLEATNLPNKKEIKESIKLMNAQQLEEFLKQNNLIQNPQDLSNSPSNPTQCVFCSIIQGKIPSHQIDDNKDSIAVLEINPISKAHVIIIPKQHIPSSDKIPQSVFSLAKKIAKKIKTRFKPKDITIVSSNMFGHEIVNVIPVYTNETINSERSQADSKELEKLKKSLEKKTKPKIIKKSKPKKIKNKIWLPKRIP